MVTNAKKVDWTGVIRIIIVVLTAIIEVVGDDSEEEKKVETKNIDKK